MGDAFRLGVLYGLRRSEVLALRWDDLDAKKCTRRIDESLVATNEGAAWSNAKNERSRRTIPIDDDTMRAFAKRRAEQAAERLAAGTEWDDNDLIITTHTGRLVLPRSYDRALATIVDHAGLPQLTSHGLRHTAATHMVQSAGASFASSTRTILESALPELLVDRLAGWLTTVCCVPSAKIDSLTIVGGGRVATALLGSGNIVAERCTPPHPGQGMLTGTWSRFASQSGQNITASILALSGRRSNT